MEFLNIKVKVQENKHMQVLETLPACFVMMAMTQLSFSDDAVVSQMLIRYHKALRCMEGGLKKQSEDADACINCLKSRMDGFLS